MFKIMNFKFNVYVHECIMPLWFILFWWIQESFFAPPSLLNNNNLHTILFPEDELIQSDNYKPFICENLKEEMVNKRLHLWV